MMNSIANAGNGLKAALGHGSTLRQIFAPTELTKSPNVFPCALIIPGTVNYQETLGTEMSVTFRILVLLAPVDTKLGMSAIVPLMERTGTESICAAIDADRTLGGNAADCVPLQCSGLGATDWSGTSYLSVEFQVEVYL